MVFEKEIETSRDLALRAGQVQDAVDALLTCERTARLAGDIPGTTEVVVAIVKICYEAKQWTMLNDTIQLLAKRRAQLKQAIQAMVQEATKWVDEQEDKARKLELISTLRLVTEGKIYVEVERARLSLTLARMHEADGKLEEARNVLQDTQVETLGGMDKREKTEFVLEQVRLCLVTNDYMRAWIMAKKINLKFFKDGTLDDLKVRYYQLVTQYHMHNKDTFELFRAFQSLHDTKTVKEDSLAGPEALKLTVIYLLLSPYSNEQHDQMHHVKGMKELEELPLYKRLVELFTTHEIFTYGDVSDALEAETAAAGPLGKALAQFGGTAEHISKTMHERIVQHNIRVLSKFYKRIKMTRLAALLKISDEEAERELSDMVTTGAVYARIDRPAGVVTFKAPQEPNELLNDWSGNISKLLNLVESTCHQIHKETMVHNVA
mmetsp:Transcript_5118/g.15146  ORF Transcript_5118/g.15146 Transcript_5118/m.15146 type:complete len:435 (+) Transcript_5118:94-1398(+)|eukprot:CAMPEP_0206043126 /NCGR_PEP_ID=MMETSP1466-20131121/7711_1 /ASSEMBLY_ACC=CAM_ASM_001126 /TAXON_ID=44452 /ORGANISM="Pavlova gyrans, Strain CCMP608" /LENGTH=434 /DNA_ID=CAMNT_0053417893 /DNA_START=76 /DNA_END=1380 /DNA_ORIENTATION=+